MTKIKPIDWDALSKVWVWDDDINRAVMAVYIYFNNDTGSYAPHKVLFKHGGTNVFANISETDPRIKTPKMRVMTAEELNDIYCNLEKKQDFRIKYENGAIGFLVFFDSHSDLKSMEYSTDRGKTWNKCEVAE